MIYILDSLRESVSNHLEDLSNFEATNINNDNQDLNESIYNEFTKLLSAIRKRIINKTEEIVIITDEIRKHVINYYSNNDEFDIKSVNMLSISKLNPILDIMYDYSNTTLEHNILITNNIGSSLKDQINAILGEIVDSDKKYTKNEILDLFTCRINGIKFALDYTNNIIKNALDEFKKCKSNIEFDSIKINTINKFRYVLAYIIAQSKAADKLFISILPNKVITEATEIKNEVEDYLTELDKCIDEIRDFYDTFKYKELVTPRKKKIDKMREYLMGALMRKYTLKIPLYKINGSNFEVKKIIEEQFIKPINNISDKYSRFIVMSPDFSEDSDMFIYLTLREPFDNINESKPINENALSLDERKSMKDSEFGLPGLRAYPIHDRSHIIKAIQMFDKCKDENKSKLAKNIAKQILRLKLVGTIVITENNKNKKYFPSWMLNKNAKLKVEDDKYHVIVKSDEDTEKTYTYTLNEACSSLNFII